VIELSDVWRTYHVGGDDVHALAGVDEEIEGGEHVAIMGPSGSGKSTLLNIVGLLDRPTRGSYLLDGREVATLDERELSLLRRETTGCVFQSHHLVPRLSARRNVELPLLFAGVSREERRRRATEALEAVGLADRAEHRPSELSGGQSQRVAIARAMILQPRILLADEPTGNLDRAAGDQVLALLHELNRSGHTLVVVTHDVTVARQAERVILLDDGRIVRRMAGSELTSVAEAIAGRRAS
jgi:putative ABC transport system ATP-binding protein